MRSVATAMAPAVAERRWWFAGVSSPARSGSGRTAVVVCQRLNPKSEMTWNDINLEQPTIPVSGESRYLTPLRVSTNVEPQQQLHHFDSSQSVTLGSELHVDSLYHQVSIKDKIRAALKRLTFREEHVLVQFWSPREDGEHQLLTTVDQPFGVGVATEQLCFYRRYSEHDGFLVDKNHENDDLSPVARVFRRGLPEWTSDLTNYNTKDFSQLACAMCCNLHGYLALPVFDSATRLCVGVLELLMSSKLEDFAYEVEHIHQELKKWNLTSPQPNLSNERNKYELDKIFDILKVVCDTHNLPLAQTWTVSPSSSYFVHEKVIRKSCSSFNTRCFNKVCISTAGLPFYAPDLSAWSFMEASKECHLEFSQEVAGRALSSRGSCFCGDVTGLDEEEYPLVHNARMSGLTSCFAIFLHSVEGNHDYVLEFFLKESRYVRNVVQTLRQSIEAVSGFELGDGSDIEVVGAHMDLSLNMTDSSDLELIVVDTSEPDYANAADQWPSTNDSKQDTCDNFAIQ